MSKQYWEKKIEEFNKQYDMVVVSKTLAKYAYDKKFIDRMPDHFYPYPGAGVFNLPVFKIHRITKVNEKEDKATVTYIKSFVLESEAKDFLRDFLTINSFDKVVDDSTITYNIKKTTSLCNASQLLSVILMSGDEPLQVLEKLEYKIRAKSLGLI